jgi:sugar phosphate isomerase/epimerase
VKLSTSDGRTIELGYCFNVLPGESVEALCEQARRIQGPVRRRLGVARMGVGLWIARAAADELCRSVEARGSLRRALRDEGLYCYTLNGFPYGGFHAPRVKERVFEPSWAQAARVDYTIDLATILADFLPDDVSVGSISTVPLGAAGTDRGAAREGIQRAADAMATLGRRIELAIEPEPGAAFERVDVLDAWLEDMDDRVGICLDTCHAAVVGETVTGPRARIVKVQISSALVADPVDAQTLHEFDEPRYLHQVRSSRGGAMDIPEALASMDQSVPWRIHFHVPVHRDTISGLGTTRASIAPTLAAVLAIPGPAPHLEVETYTWGVLPTKEDDLVEGIACELEWTLAVLADLGVRA